MATAATNPSNAPPATDSGKLLDIARPTAFAVKKKATVEKERVSVFDRKYKGAPVQIRAGLADEYEIPKSHRESWWRINIRETPLPHHYGTESLDTFLVDLDKSRNTYSFKSDGRRLDPIIGGKGCDLLPGAYEYRDFISEIARVRPQKTYSFKNSSRGLKDILNEGIKDKDINVAPNLYNTETYNATTVIDPKNKSHTFKSTTKRFPTIYFCPKTGPAPGEYNARAIHTSPNVTSSFRSGTPRFKTSTTKVPGPGMYESTFQTPQKPTVKNMGRKHGLFFACSFDK